MKVGGSNADYRKENPYDVNASIDVVCVLPRQLNQNGRENEEEDIGDLQKDQVVSV